MQDIQDLIFQSYQGSIFTLNRFVEGKVTGNFQSYQGSIFTETGTNPIRNILAFNPIKVLFLQTRTIKQEQRRMTFNPIKVLFLPEYTREYQIARNPFNPIKVLFLRSSDISCS